MSALLLCAWLSIVASVARDAEEQVLFVQLVAEGPLDAVVVDSGGASGAREPRSWTRVDGPLRAGERRTLVLPVPLWREALGAEPPIARALGEGQGASARVAGLAGPQPSERLEHLPPGLLGRPWPAPPALAARPAWAALAAVVLALCASLAARRRPLALTCAALAGALSAFLAARPARALPPEARVLEADLASALCLEVRAAQGEIELGFDGLLVEPAGTPLEIRCGFDGSGSVRASGALLVARRVVPPPGKLDRSRNGWGDFAAVWVRGASGRWGFHGAWRAASALPPERAGPAVPAWLAAGVPPGTGVLVGELHEPGAGWVRAVGFEAP